MIQKYIQYLRLIGLGKGRIFLHILIHVLDGVREFVVNIFAVSFYIACLQEEDGKRFFAGLAFFCGINLALRGVSRWYRECYSEQADILQEGRIVHRIEERATAVPYASYEKTAFLNRLEYLANHASATYEKIMGNIGNTVRLASALVAVLTYLATLDPVLFVVAIAPFLLTMVLRRQGEVRHDYEVEKSVHDRKKAYVWRKFFFHENMEELRTSDAYSILDHLNREAETGNCTLAREKGGTLALLGFLADNLGATFAFTAGNIYALWKFWTQEGLPVSEYSVLVLSIANLNAKLVRLGTEYARFTENLLYVEDFLNFFAEEKPAQKDETQEEILQSVEAKQLSFTYPNGTAGLHDISFLAKKGERVVLVGGEWRRKVHLPESAAGALSGFYREAVQKWGSQPNRNREKCVCVAAGLPAVSGDLWRKMFCCGNAEKRTSRLSGRRCERSVWKKKSKACRRAFILQWSCLKKGKKPCFPPGKDSGLLCAGCLQAISMR